MTIETAPAELSLRFHETFSAYMAAIEDPEGGEALHALQADEAPLLTLTQPRRKREISAEAFADGHRGLAALHARHHGTTARQPALDQLRLADMTLESPERAVAWFEGRERQTGQTLHVGVGFRHEPDGWRIGWACLAPSPRPWSYALGLAQTLAEHPYLDAERLPRTWLDVSYRRLHDMPTAPLLVAPDARFSCHGSSTCCRVDYEVILPPEAQDFIDAVPWETVDPPLAGTRLPVMPDGRLKLKAEGEPCRFLDEARRCRVHSAMGRSVFSPCTSFPYLFAETPEGVAVTTSTLCDSVRANVGLPIAAQADDVRARMLLHRPRRTDAYKLARGHEVSWEEFSAAETALIALLDREDLPLYRRLYMGCRLLEAWKAGEREVDEAWGTAMIRAIAPEDKAALRGAWPKLFPWVFEEYDGEPPAVHHGEVREEALLAKTLKTLLYSKMVSYPTDLLTAHHAGILLYMLALTLQAHPKGRADPDRVRQVIGLVAFHDNILERHCVGRLAPNKPFSDDLAGPDFGPWALGYGIV